MNHEGKGIWPVLTTDAPATPSQTYSSRAGEQNGIGTGILIRCEVDKSNQIKSNQINPMLAIVISHINHRPAMCVIVMQVATAIAAPSESLSFALTR
jgi:hypothetical protein